MFFIYITELKKLNQPTKKPPTKQKGKQKNLPNIIEFLHGII